jgi:hypothetical protein
MHQYTFLIGCLILTFVWIGLYNWCKDLRKVQLFGSWLALPLGLTEILFVPEYWSPVSLFNLISRYGVGIEDFILAFVGGGITAIIYKVVTKTKIEKYEFKNKGFFPYILFIGLFLGLEIILPKMTIYNLFLAFFIGNLYVAFSRPDLIKQMILSGLIFGGLYFIFFKSIDILFLNFIGNTYNISRLMGINIFGVPVEEILFGIMSGSFWGVIYEYVNGYGVAIK